MLRAALARMATVRTVVDAARFVRRASPRLALLVLGVQVATSAVVVLELVAIRTIVDRFVNLAEQPSLGSVLVPLIGFGLLIALRTTAEAASRELQWAVAERTEQVVVGDVLDVAAQVPFEELERAGFRDRLSRAMQAARNDVWDVAYGTLAVVQAAITTVGLIGYLATIAPVLLPAFAVAGVLILVLGQRMGQARYVFEHHDTPTDRERRYLAEALTSRTEAKELRVFSSARSLYERHQQLMDLRIDRLNGLLRHRIVVSLAGNVALAVVLIGSLAAIAWLTVEGRIAVADAAVTAVTAQQLSNRLRSLTNGMTAIHDSAVFLRDVPAFVEQARADIARHPVAVPAPDEPRRIVAEEVCYRYPDTDRPALVDVDLVLEPGQVVALVGENGSGKSTLAKLLCGLYRPTAGTVAVVGADGARTPVADLVGGRSAVFQDFARYELTAADNVALGDIDRRDDIDGIHSALARASAAEFIDALPQGEATRLGRRFSGGIDLSLGQWQRLALARAVFRDAPLLVLDEPTASLDAQAEVDLLGQLRRWSAGRAILLISHRYSTVRAADRIVVLHDGHVVEDGAHSALMAADGLYADFVRLQS